MAFNDLNGDNLKVSPASFSLVTKSGPRRHQCLQTANTARSKELTQEMYAPIPRTRSPY
jgi:hypothetical protein